MNTVVAMLCAFVGLGLAGRRLGKLTYVLMAIVILAYVAHAYNQ